MGYIKESSFSEDINVILVDGINQIFKLDERFLYKRFNRKIVGFVSNEMHFVFNDKFIADNPSYLKYLLKYEDKDGNVIENFAFQRVEEMRFIDANIAPYHAQHFGIYDIYGVEKLGEILLNNKLRCKYGERLYRFGVLSDIHFEYEEGNASSPAYGYMEASSHAEDDYIHALSFFEKKENVDFTCACGDLGIDKNDGDGKDWKRFATALTEYHQSKPFYTCRGNHDSQPNSNVNVSDWWKYTFREVNNENEVVYQDSASTNNFYFNYGNDTFIFLCAEDVYGSNMSMSEGNRTWFNNVMRNELNGKRRFVFMHFPFFQKAGNLADAAPTLYGGGNTVFRSGTGETRMERCYNVFNPLQNDNKQDVWFNGHTHYDLRCQRHSRKANVTNLDSDNDNVQGAWNVHVPSCAYPRAVTYSLSGNNETSVVSLYDSFKNSQGIIVDVYENFIDVRGIHFKDMSHIDMSDVDYVKKEDILVKQNADLNGITNLDDDYVEITFNHTEEKYFITSKNYPTDEDGNILKPSYVAAKIVFEDVKIFNNERNEVTKAFFSDGIMTKRLGIWVGGNYRTLNTDCDAFLDSQWVQLINSIGGKDEPNLGFPFYVHLKMKIKYIDDTDARIKYLPIANYRLDNNRVN